MLGKFAAPVEQVFVEGRARQTRDTSFLEHFAKQRMRLGAGGGVALRDDVAVGVVFFHELFDPCLVARLLVKVVAGQGDDDKTVTIELRMQLLKALKLRYEPALGRNVDEQERLVAIAFQVNTSAREVHEMMIEQIHAVLLPV